MSFGESVPRAGSAGGGGGGGGGGGVVAGCGTERARPLSGVWALLARLRRSPSQDSLSSAGSDATISFAFLSPPVSTHPQLSHDPAPAPLTDSYKKRVRDRNVRRQHDRDLTLHRKYGLPRGDATFDAFSLPHFANVRRTLIEPSAARERRAASESLPRCAAHVPGVRCAAHVPGKRRAPPPPRPASFAAPSLGRRHSRKRPAPQPPITPLLTATDTGVGKENIDTDTLVKMKSNKSDQDKRPVSKDSLRHTPEKSSKKDSDNRKVPKMKREKSFLQQIFEGRKRGSTMEPPPERLLPSISELDKQAAEIIETYRLKPLAQNNRDNTTPNKGDAWFCTLCLRKYNSTVVTCLYCLPEQNNLRNGLTADFRNTAKDTNIYTQIEDRDTNIASSSGVNGIAMDEKQKLKEMLKEMKYSLPKRSKQDDTEKLQNVSKTTEWQESKAKITPIKIDNTKESNRQIRERSEETERGNKRDSYYDPVTLRIGSVPEDVMQTPADPQPSSSKQIVKLQAVKNEVRLVNVKTEHVKETAVITQPVVLVAPHPRHHGNVSNNISNKAEININSVASTSKGNLPQDVKPKKPTHNDSTHNQQNMDKNINSGSNNPIEPVKLSSLLNPIYIPQQSNVQDRRRLFFSANETPTRESKSIPNSGETGEKHGASSTTTSVTVTKLSTSIKPESTKENFRRPKENTPPSHSKLRKESTPPTAHAQHHEPVTSSHNPPPNQKPPSTSSVSTSTSNTPISENFKISNANMVKMSVDQHSKRREWVNQLEQSIAKGDEQAAAQAAARLAQLRVACSVLSFSSQIVGESSKSVTHNSPKPQNSAPNDTNINKQKLSEPTQSTSKVNAGVQSMEIVSPKGNAKNSSSKEAGSAIQINSQGIKVSSSLLTPEPSPLLSASKPELSAKKVESNDSKGNLAGPSSSKTEKIVVGNGSNFVSISIWVEDREATRGPVRLSIPRHCSLGELRRRAQAALGLQATLQRWIVGRTLCTEDATVLANLAGPELAAPFYLCVVADTETMSQLQTKPSTSNRTPQKQNDTTDVYSQLMQLEQHALVPNTDSFQCGVCMEQCAVDAGAVLRECVHEFCRGCLSALVRHCAEPIIACPALGCPGTLQEREIKAVVDTDEYERWLARGLAAAESGSRNAFHCRTRDCAGWALCEPGVRRFPCPVCKQTNCVPCQAIHEGETCDEHRTRLQTAATALGGAGGAGGADTDGGTRALLDQMIAKGEALQCPECSALITKKWGCDWVKCSACKTEICWVTRGRRWGPGGRGDTSAGCRCGVDGRRCHPSCGYCH